MEKATDLIHKVELFDQLVRPYLKIERNPATPPLNLLVFSKRRDFIKLVNKRHFAAFTQPGLVDTLLVIGPSRPPDSLLSNALHEYIHYLLRTQTIDYPMWYEEGLASVLSRIEFNQVDASGASATIGRLSKSQRRPPPRQFKMSLSEIVNAKDMTRWPGARMTEFYQQSATLVHFFLFAEGSSHPDYREKLQHYFNHREEDLFTAIDISKYKLTNRWQRYLGKSKLPTRILTAATPPKLEAIHSQTLSERDAKLWQARAAEILNPKKALKLYQALAAEDPAQLDAHIAVTRILASSDLDRAAHQLAELLETAPNNSDLLVVQAGILTRQCGLDAKMTCRAEWQQAAKLLRQALRLDPNHLEAILQLGVIELYTGNPGRAINYLRIAYNRVPWSAKVNLHLGECLRLLGNSQAQRHLTQARDWAFNDGVRRLATYGLELLHNNGRAAQ